MSTLNITIICENTVNHHEGLIAEHGFSAHVQLNETNFLFDTGQGLGLLPNANRLKIDLRSLDFVAISHGHWDHTGGLGDLLKLQDNNLTIVAHQGIFVERYYTQEDGVLRDAGIRNTKQYFQSFGGVFSYNNTPYEISEDIFLTGEIPRYFDFEQPASQLKLMKNKELISDTVIDEQSLVIKTKKGLVIIMGCGHPGVLNTIKHSQEITGEEKIHAIIGGTHMMFLPEKQLQKTINGLKKHTPYKIGTSHCTGGIANSILRSNFPQSFIECNVGVRLAL